MTGTRSISAALVVCALTMASFPARAGAQVSDARIKELMREAEAAALQVPTSPNVQVPGEGPTLALTLDDAVKFALERNLDIAVQRLNPQLQDIAIATARAAFIPSLTSTLSRTSITSPPTSAIDLGQGGVGGTQTGTTTYNGSLTKLMSWYGGQFTAQLNNNRQETTRSIATYNPSFNSTWNFSYVQPLLRDSKIDTQRRQLSVSQVNREISDVQLRASLTNLVSNVGNAYWDYVYTTQAVEVAQQSYDLAGKLVQDNQTRVEIGTMAPIDVVQAQAEQATRRQALVTAQNNRRTAELALKRLIVGGTEDPNWAATLDPVDRPDFNPTTTIDVEAAIRRALAERTDLEIAHKNVENNNTTLTFLRNQTLPIVDLQVNYGVQGVGGPFTRRTTLLGTTQEQTIPGGPLDAYASLFHADNPRWTLGLNVTYPLGTSTQEAAVARARVQLGQIQAQLRQIELTIATEVTNAAIQVRNTTEAVEASQAARDLSQRRLEAEQSKFEVGMSTNYFVVQAQRDLNDARNSELRAILNYRKALVELERLQQTTLSNANITILAAGGGGGGGF
jgi:outer membrane protein